MICDVHLSLESRWSSSIGNGILHTQADGAVHCTWTSALRLPAQTYLKFQRPWAFATIHQQELFYNSKALAVSNVAHHMSK